MAMDSRQMAVRTKNLILGIDPGRDKTGFAFIDSDGNLLLSGIFASSEREDFFAVLSSENKNFSRWTIEGSPESLEHSQIKFIALGDGTQSQKFFSWLNDKNFCEIIRVNEKNSTLEARAIYWKIHRPSLLMRLIPEGLRVPARVLDDLAAYIIALRALQNIEI